MKLTRKLIAAMLSVLMVMMLLTSAFAAEIKATYSAASYYDIAVTAYSRMLAFQNGAVAAADQTKKYGLIDATGNVIVPFQYAYVWALGGGLFGVAENTDEYGQMIGLGVINSSGETVLAPSEDCTSLICYNGVVQVQTRQLRQDSNPDWPSYDYQTNYYTTGWQPSTEEAFYDRTENTTPPQLAEYDWYYQTRNGSYQVYKNSENGSQMGILDSNYQVVIPLGEYDSCNDLSNGCYVVGKRVSEDSYFYTFAVLDSNGQVVIPMGEYDSYEQMWRADGYYQVSKNNGEDNTLRGVLDSDLQVIVPLGEYQYFGTPNANGYISATKQDGSTDLYKDGTLVKTYPDKQVTTEVYYRHLAFSTTNGEKHGMMDIDGNVLLSEQFTYITTDRNDHLLTVNSGEDWWYTYGLYTQEGEEIFKTEYSEITHLADSKYRLQKGEYFGMSQVSGTTVTPVIPLKYTEMRVHTLQFIELYDGSKYSVVDFSNNVVVPESSEPVDVLKGDGDLNYTLNRVTWYAPGWDNYTKSVLPFLSSTDNGWTTVYADFNTGEVSGQISGVRASNINDDGWFAYQNADGLFGFAKVGDADVNKPSAIPTTPAPAVAYPSTQKVDLNGTEVEFQMYALKDANGNDTNHIKIRDLALALNGTSATFNIGWENGMASIETGKAYEPNGSENKTPFSGQRPYTKSAISFILDGSPIELESIGLTDDAGNGYTYCQVKNLADKLNFTARWDAARQIICIETE